MSGYDVLASRGDPISADYHLAVYLYAHQDSSNTYENRIDGMISNKLEVALDKIYNNSSIDYYEISKCVDNPDLDQNSIYDEANAFECWLGKDTCDDSYSKYDNNRPYGDYQGAHILVSDTGLSGEPQGISATEPTAFNGSAFGVVGGDDKQGQTHTTVHEAMHCCINLVYSTYNIDDEHDLATVFGVDTDYDGNNDEYYRTILSVSSENVESGPCQSTQKFPLYDTYEPSSCAVNAIEDTAVYS